MGEIKAEWTVEELDYLTEVESTTKTTQDWVIVVRCKDCKWWTQANAMHWGQCELSNGVCPNDDWFCADGERKDNATD